MTRLFVLFFIFGFSACAETERSFSASLATQTTNISITAESEDKRTVGKSARIRRDSNEVVTANSGEEENDVDGHSTSLNLPSLSSSAGNSFREENAHLGEALEDAALIAANANLGRASLNWWELNSGVWEPYYGEYGSPSYSVIDGVCFVEGRIKVKSGQSWNDLLATLPSECRPKYHLIFNLNNKEFCSRVDVLSNGEVRWVVGGKSHGWISLTGIKFVTKDNDSNLIGVNYVQNGGGWPHAWDYGDNYGGAYYTKINGECILQGLMTVACWKPYKVADCAWSELAKVGPNCKPQKTLLFDVNLMGCHTTLEIHSDGLIKANPQCENWHR